MELTMKNWLKIVILIIAILVMGGISVLVFPYIASLSEEANRIAFEEYINSLGIWGMLLLFSIQILQVIVAVIPGEPIEIIAGIMYGTFGGLFLCLSGILISSVIVYFTVKKFGKNFINKIYKKEESSKYNFLLKAENVTYLIFLLFLIPGTPKDVLVYLCPFTKIKPITFFLISTFARIPSIVTSTYAGSNISEGNFIKSILIFVFTGIIGILGIIIHNSFIKKRNVKNT
jgi:uncharacterized membrane protein YdjX (TVP38/TMEM64 family)